MSARRAAAMLAVTAALAGGGTVAAFAKHGGGIREYRAVQTVADPQDVSSPLDIASARFGQVGRQVTLAVHTRGAWDADQLAAAPNRRVCLLLASGKAPPSERLCVAGRKRAHPFGLRLTRLAPSGAATGSRFVPARVTRRDGRSFDATLDPADLGLRAGGRYRWHVETAWDGAVDEAPDSGDVAARIAHVRPVACRAAGAHEVRNGPRSRRVVALTFDDGPSTYTPQVLRILEHAHVPATFFLIGRQIGRYAGYPRRALADGDIVGDHTWDHANVAGGGAHASSELSRTKSEIRRALAFDTCVFRPPYGATSSSLVAISWAQRMKEIVWDVDPRDWSRPGAGAVYSRVVGAVRPGSIVLMHDGGGPRDQTVAALPRIIRTLRARGYSFDTAPQLFGLRVVYGRG